MTKKRVLLIDDSKLARFALSKLLKEQGLKVEAFESAEDGLNYLARESAHAVFMDHLMPGMDGLEATRVIRQNPATAGIPVVLCTSNDSDEHRDTAIEAGALDLLPKPVNPQLLTRVLQEIDDAVAAASPTPTAAPGLSIEEIESLVDSRIHALLDDRLADIQRELMSLQESVASNSQILPIDEESLLETAEANATRVAREMLEAQASGSTEATLATLEGQVTAIESRVSELAAESPSPVDLSSLTAQANESAIAEAEKLVADQASRRTGVSEELEHRLAALSQTMADMSDDFQARLVQSKEAIAEETRQILAVEKGIGKSGDTLSQLEDRLRQLEAGSSAPTGEDGATTTNEPMDAAHRELKRGLRALEGKLKLYAGGAALAGILAAVIF